MHFPSEFWQSHFWTNLLSGGPSQCLHLISDSVYLCFSLSAFAQCLGSSCPNIFFSPPLAGFFCLLKHIEAFTKLVLGFSLKLVTSWAGCIWLYLAVRFDGNFLGSSL